MNAATREKLLSATDQDDLSVGNAVWQTAPKLFAKLAEDFGPFDVDICGDTVRALVPKWFGPESDLCSDALRANWIEFGSNGFDNPPYGSFIQKILKVAKAQAALGFSSTHLLPMRVTRAFKTEILKGASDLLFCSSRLVFFEDGLPRLNEREFEKGNLIADSAVFDSIVVRYRPGAFERPHVDVWDVPKHITKADLERAAERLLSQRASGDVVERPSSVWKPDGQLGFL